MPENTLGQAGRRCLLAMVGFVVIGSGSVSAVEVQKGYYDDPGIHLNRAYISDHLAEHIDPFNGSVQHQYVDLFLPGNGKFDLKLIRTYNSALVSPMSPLSSGGADAAGWDIHFGRVVTKYADAANYLCQDLTGLTAEGNPVLVTPDGTRQVWYYPANSPGTNDMPITPQGWRMQCTPGVTGVSVYSPDGIRYDMAQLAYGAGDLSGAVHWLTTRITDRNGNYANINYVVPSNYGGGGTSQISSVVTSDGRRLDFTYVQDTNTVRQWLSSVRASTGQSVEYIYQDGYYYNGFISLLSKVLLSDGTSWSYTYKTVTGVLESQLSGNFQIATVTTPQGGQINYGYSWVDFYSTGATTRQYFSSALTSKTTSDGGSWAYSYSPSKSLNTYDITTEVGPAGTTIYNHYGYQTVANGSVWKIGLLASKTIGSSQTESYTWGKRRLSSELMTRPLPWGGYVKSDPGESNAAILVSKTIARDGASYETSYSSFDSYGNPGLVAETGPGGGVRSTSISYYINTTKWIIKQPQDELFAGGSISRFFDGNGNLSSIHRDGVTTSYSYDAQGNVSSATLPRGLLYSYSSYKRGIPQFETQPEAIVISRIVSDAGNVTSETNSEGKTKTFSYDLMNRVTGIGYPAGHAVGISYTATTKTATRGSLTESTTYDGFGRPMSVTLGGVTRTYRYDALGRKVFESNPGSASGTTYEYDILDRITRITNADGTTQIRNYGAGTVTVTDERNIPTTYWYRSYGDPAQQFLMSIIVPINFSYANVLISRNAKDQVIGIKQGNLKRTYGYNANYYLTSVTHPETGTTTYGRDAAGNMTSRTVGTSGTSTYTYDGQNRLTAVTYPGATPSVTKTYSKTHKLKTVVSSAARRSYAYDANDNLTGESVVVDGMTLTTGYAYNGNDQLASITYPASGRVVSFSPDVLGRPTAVSGYVTSASYWPSGQVKQINYANGTISTYGQNSRLWPSTFATQLGSTYYNNASYTYDGAGNLKAINDAADANYSRTLGYDALNRLTSANGPWGTGTLAYSSVGNLTSQVLGGSSLYYTYDTQNRLSSISGYRAGSYTYDAYGDIVTGSGNTYTYDGVPNLTCVNCGTANQVANIYDGLNQRVSVTKGGVKTYEVYGSHGNLLAEYTPSQANKLVEYIYLGGKRVAQRETRQ